MAALNAAAPRITDRLCEACAEHFAAVRAHLDALGVAVPARTGARARPRLLHADRVRVLRRAAARASSRRSAAAAATTASSSCSAGGRRPGIGFGIGLDRLVLALDGDRVTRSSPEPAPVAVVVGADPDDTVARLRIATDLRAAGIAARAELGRRKLGKQLEAAARDGAHFAVILGDELATARSQLRDLPAGTQKARRPVATWPASWPAPTPPTATGRSRTGAVAEVRFPDDEAEALIAAETALARRDPAWPGGLETLLDGAFAEVGAGGRAWSRDDVVAMLAADPPNRIELRDLVVERLADDVALVRFVTERGGPCAPPGEAGLRSRCVATGRGGSAITRGRCRPMRRPGSDGRVDLLHPSAARGLRGHDDRGGEHGLGRPLRAVQARPWPTARSSSSGRRSGSRTPACASSRRADEAAARRFMEEDPVIAGGYARGELRPFRVSLLRGRD